MTSLTKTKIIGTGLPCLFGGFQLQLQLYLSLILLYHPARPILITANYCPTPVPQIVSCQY